MGIRFENRFVPDEKMLRAYFFRIGRAQHAIGGIGFLAFLIACFAFDFPFLDMLKKMPTLFFVAAGAIVAYNLAGRPLLQARRGIGSRPTGAGAESAVRFGERIEATGSGATRTLDYSQITAFYETKRVWILMLHKNDGILLRPDGFTVGDPAAFEAFLREKCPNLK